MQFDHSNSKKYDGLMSIEDLRALRLRKQKIESDKKARKYILEINQRYRKMNSSKSNNVLRIMPNLLIQDKNGFIPFTSNYEGDYLNFIHNILENLGTVKEIDESMVAIVTALSGSGPAWFYELSNQLVNAGTELGLSLKDSELIIKELVKALPSLVHEDETFSDLVNKVKSSGGTTEAGLNSLNNASFDTIILEAIQKATQRSTEISKELTNE